MYHSSAPVLDAVKQPDVSVSLLEMEHGQQQLAHDLGSVAMLETVAQGGVAPSHALRVGSLAFIGRLFKRLLPQEAGGTETDVAESISVDAAELIERRGYVRVAPRFADQAQDTKRTNEFKYKHPYRGTGSMTEYAGLQELSTFLRSDPKPLFASMHEHLTFIGEKEYAEASEGLAAYWKRHLESGKDAQLCPLALISSPEGKVKSDQYLLERILAHFTDEELKRYRGQIVFDPKMLTSDPRRVKVVMLDDWVISGSQMRSAGYSAMMSLSGPARKYRDSLELNLITASRKRLSEQNFEIDDTKFKLPVRAYYMAHDSNGGPVEYTANSAYVSGTHSSTDYEFSNKLGGYESSPALAHVVRAYRKSSRPEYHRARKHLGLGSERGSR